MGLGAHTTHGAHTRTQGVRPSPYQWYRYSLAGGTQGAGAVRCRPPLALAVRVQATLGTAGAQCFTVQHRAWLACKYPQCCGMQGYREKKTQYELGAAHTTHNTYTSPRPREKLAPTHASLGLRGRTPGLATHLSCLVSLKRLAKRQKAEGRDGRSTAAPLLSALAMDDSEQEFAQLGGGHGRGRLAPYPPTLRGRPPRPRDPYPPSLLPLMLKYQDTLTPPKPRRPCGGECPSFCSAAFDQRAAPFDWRVTLRSKSAPF